MMPFSMSVRARGVVEVIRQMEREVALNAILLDDTLWATCSNPFRQFLQRSLGREWLHQASGNIMDFYMPTMPFHLFSLGLAPDMPQSALQVSQNYPNCTVEVARLLDVKEHELPCLFIYPNFDSDRVLTLSLADIKDTEDFLNLLREIIQDISSAIENVLDKETLSEMRSNYTLEPRKFHPENQERIFRDFMRRIRGRKYRTNLRDWGETAMYLLLKATIESQT